MGDSRNIPLERLAVEATHPKWAKENLSRPDRIQWPSDPKAWIPLHREMVHRLPPRLHPLWVLSVAAHFLMCGKPMVMPFFEDVRRWDLLPEWVFRFQGSWRLVSVVTVESADPRCGCIVPFMVGTVSPAESVSCWPSWMTRHLDGSALSGIETAFAAARRICGIDFSLFVFPLMAPDDDWMVQGRSLGLPMALGAMSALKKEPLISDVLATGDIEAMDPFRIFPAAAVAPKIQAATEASFRLVLIPDTDRNGGKGDPLHRQMPVVGVVGNLNEAWMWATWFSSERESDLLLYQQITRRQDAKLLVNNCRNIHIELLESLLSCNGYPQLSERLVQDRECVETLVDKLGACLSTETFSLKRALAIRRLISRETVFPKMAELWPTSAFKWAIWNLKLANAIGDNSDSRCWQKEATTLQNHCRELDPQANSQFINNLCVTLHNAYAFHPDIPEAFRLALDNEERYHHGQVNPVLGAMYGTLAQHYGFCGPPYLHDVVHYVGLAQKMFGDGRVNELRQEWVREFAYLVYAFLDAKDFEAARKALWRYLEVQSWSDLKPWTVMKPYERFTAARYMADRLAMDADEAESRIADHWLKTVHYESASCPEHPHQLIAWNMGRIAWELKQTDTAKGWWEKSLELCGSGGETVAVMALLPLSGLHRAGGFSERHCGMTGNILQHIRCSQSLHRDHFKPLLGGSLEGTLNLVWNHAKRFFPFSYR